MNLTQEQIEQEFRRQVHLCYGIGVVRMFQIIADYAAEKSGINYQMPRATSDPQERP